MKPGPLHPVSWYLQSMGDRDTHRGEFSPVTRSVTAVCGVEFVPLQLPFGASRCPVTLRTGIRSARAAGIELPHRFPPGDRPVPLSSDQLAWWRAALMLTALVMGKGKHRKPRRRARLCLRPPALFAWVDLRTKLTHLLTPDAAAAGRVGGGRYIALCGADVIPASMTDPGNGYCQSCYTTSIPHQRTRR